MSQAKSKTEYITSPVGDLEWVVIEGEGKEMLNGENKYVGHLVLDGDKAEAFKKQILDFWEENKPKGFSKKYPNDEDKNQVELFGGAKRDFKSAGIYAHYEYVLDEDGNVKLDEDGDKVKRLTGKTSFIFTTAMTYGDGSAKVVKVFDKNGNEVNLNGKRIGNGSRGRFNAAMGIYAVENKGKILDAGVALYLNGLQIGKFVEYQAGPSFDAMDDEEADWEGPGEMGTISDDSDDPEL